MDVKSEMSRTQAQTALSLSAMSGLTRTPVALVTL